MAIEIIAKGKVSKGYAGLWWLLPLDDSFERAIARLVTEKVNWEEFEGQELAIVRLPKEAELERPWFKTMTEVLNPIPA